MAYSLVGLQLASDNIIKQREAAHSAKPEIMQPNASLVPPPLRPGYSLTYLPTWCNYGESCGGVLCAITQKQQGKYLPPKSRSPSPTNSTITQLS